MLNRDGKRDLRGQLLGLGLSLVLLLLLQLLHLLLLLRLLRVVVLRHLLLLMHMGRERQRPLRKLIDQSRRYGDQNNQRNDSRQRK